MIELDLPAELTTTMREAARAADIAAARAFGFGGEVWDVSVPTGTGPAARTMVPSGSVGGLAYRQAPAVLKGSTAGVLVGGEQWRFILFSGSLQPNAQITSRTTPAYRFTVVSLEPWYDHAQAELSIR